MHRRGGSISRAGGQIDLVAWCSPDSNHRTRLELRHQSEILRSCFSAWGIHNIDCIVTAMNRHPGVYRAMLAILLDVAVFASQRFVHVGGSTILIHMLESHIDRKALTAFGAASHTWCDVAPSPSKAPASVETPTTDNSACNRRCGFCAVLCCHSLFVFFIEFDAAFDLESWGCSGFPHHAIQWFSPPRRASRNI